MSRILSENPLRSMITESFLFVFHTRLDIDRIVAFVAVQDPGQESDVSNPPEHYISKVNSIAEVILLHFYMFSNDGLSMQFPSTHC